MSTPDRSPGLWRRIPLWQKILVGLALGVLVGTLMGESASVFKPIGDIFISAIKMLIVPLVFSTLVVGITAMRDPQKMGRIGARPIALYLVTTAFAIATAAIAAASAAVIIVTIASIIFVSRIDTITTRSIITSNGAQTRYIIKTL